MEMTSGSSMSNDIFIQRKRKVQSKKAPSYHSTRYGNDGDAVAAVSVETTPLLPIQKTKETQNHNWGSKLSSRLVNTKIHNSKALDGNIFNKLDQTDIISNIMYWTPLQRKQYDPLESLEQSECATRLRKYTSTENIRRKSKVEPLVGKDTKKINLSPQKKYKPESNTIFSNSCEPTEKTGLNFRCISKKSYNSVISCDDNTLVEGSASSTECNPHYQSQSLTDKIYHCIYTHPTRQQSPTQAHTHTKPYRQYIKLLEMESINNNNKSNTRINEIHGKSNGRSPILSASRSRQKKFVTKIKLWAVMVCVFALTVGVISIALLQTHDQDDESQRVSQVDETSQRNLSVKQTNNNDNANKMSSFIEVDESTMEQYRLEFQEWIEHHTKRYESEEVREKRFKIWVSNHLRTQKKNELHGPCKMTKQPVFGSNHFKDLHPEEFQAKYLTGYTGPVTEKLRERRTLRSDQRRHFAPKGRPVVSDVVTSDGMNNPKTAMDRHPSVQDRYLEHLEKTPMMSKTYINHWESMYTNNCGYQKTFVKRDRSQYKNNYKSKYSSCNRYRSTYQESMTLSSFDCSWYNLSCWFRWLFSKGYSHVGKTREPSYNGNNYPTAIDWRDLGAVTSVHSQGSCGACWAITAVETIESANYIKTGQLLDLSETEVIACDDSCIMCDGGWPQNAYEYVSKYNGLPLENTLQYDDEFLYMLSQVTTGQSDALTENEVDNYLSTVCPAGGQSGSQSGSQDNVDYDDSTPRYGAVKGYAYATDRCVCYEDGTGCDCDEQNEILAVRNVASYGPATVCLEASTWQDYSGGIITADSGCSQQFLNMNHCVQVVGYAYYDVDDEDGDNQQQEQQNSKSGSGSQDEKDNQQREGYWIVRNQWSDYWGMYGYAYVAMGANTCGILNDITQVFME